MLDNPLSLLNQGGWIKAEGTTNTPAAVASEEARCGGLQTSLLPQDAFHVLNRQGSKAHVLAARQQRQRERGPTHGDQHDNRVTRRFFKNLEQGTLRLICQNMRLIEYADFFAATNRPEP